MTVRRRWSFIWLPFAAMACIQLYGRDEPASDPFDQVGAIGEEFCKQAPELLLFFISAEAG